MKSAGQDLSAARTRRDWAARFRRAMTCFCNARAVGAVCLVLLVSGCYVSKAPFITPAIADYPIADGTRFDAFLPRGQAWRPQPARTIQRIGTHYVYREEGSTRRSIPFLLKQIAPRRYVIQLSDTADPARITEYYYALIDFDGTTAVQYQPACGPRPAWIARGWIERVEKTSTNDRCIFASFEHLKSVLTEAAIKAAPEAKFVIGRPAQGQAAPAR